jgi:AcrR family transcriptional regulator
MTEIKQKLPAAERRRAVLETACRMFAERGYRGTTTAEIARALGCSEPILYRHFPSKRDLYFAAIEHAWTEFKDRFEALADAPDPVAAVRENIALLAQGKERLSHFWAQALTEVSDDPEMRRFIRRHLKDVHAFLAGMLRRAQELGIVHPDRDVEAEAWITIGGVLLGTMGERIGGLFDDVAPRIAEQRRRWMTGSA